ncbi:hypothetical protein HK102_004676 [Quaeritorhiza haematococci]|nr:hypothetical protein HK102_004676 [Quaeritorhiza haematococci]
MPPSPDPDAPADGLDEYRLFPDLSSSDGFRQVDKKFDSFMNAWTTLWERGTWSDRISIMKSFRDMAVVLLESESALEMLTDALSSPYELLVCHACIAVHELTDKPKAGKEANKRRILIQKWLLSPLLTIVMDPITQHIIRTEGYIVQENL